jgi:hypothetical protein
MANQSTQYVLRIEHPESKTGPYTHDYGDIIPGVGWGPATVIYDDLVQQSLFSKQILSGVEYMSQLYEWFGDSLDYLADAGFKLCMYLLPVDKVLRTHSGLQVAFNPADALEVTVL